ncbi:MAG: hypothetical protein RAO92_10220 [Candidatus Euphemobacter frigidus]|nr:hypothetical protein [Candidatus Euphemobacter frigidus]MDP8276759.1 hypothetical protein [Candidatus Euphemobacter frigidus]
MNISTTSGKDIGFTWNTGRFYPHLIGWAVVISLFLHVIIILSLKKIPIFSPGVILIPSYERSVHLKFVDSPQRIEEVGEEPETDLISDQTSRAQDVIPDKADRTDSPRSVGTIKEKSIRKMPAGRPGALEAPQQPKKEPDGKVTSSGETQVGKTGASKESEPDRIAMRPGEESPISARGEDKFFSPEAESPEGKTWILKQVAYNTRSTAVGKYLARMKPRIVNLWHFNIMNNTFYVRSSETHILFEIMPDGAVGKLVVNEHDGPDIEMRYSLNAIEQAQPFEPLNQEILEYIRDNGLWLEFNFLYH